MRQILIAIGPILQFTLSMIVSADSEFRRNSNMTQKLQFTLFKKAGLARWISFPESENKKHP